MSYFIESAANQKIKDILKLSKASERKKQGVVLVEGRKELEMALKAGLPLLEVFYCADFGGQDPLSFGVGKEKIIGVSQKVFEKMTYREKPDGYLAVFTEEEKKLSDVRLSQNALVLILEATEKPGNLGAIARTANAAGVNLIIVNDPQVDVHHPNAIRASIGSIFDLPVVKATREETIAYLKENKIISYATSKRGKKDFYEFDYSKGIAFVLGAEHSGLSEEWREGADEYINIPMTGIVDSLNLSVSAAVLLFEAVRQRKSK
jgi:TrmH family RNA methyltransferase